MKFDKVEEAKKVFETEIDALEKMKDSIDETFVQILDLVTSCDGKVIITGMGKPGHIAKKIASTMASLGTPSFFIHPGEALHGDLGMVSEKDIVIAISYSGESEEITRILPNIKMIGAKIVAISGNRDSTLVKYSDISQVLPNFEEACYLGLAPTSSTTTTLVYGDALAVVASGAYGFRKADFGRYHPAGSLGKKLILKTQDLMVQGELNPVIKSVSLLMDAIVEMSKKGLGVVSVVDENQELCGIITDGDLRRALQKKIDVYSVGVCDVMIPNPLTVSTEAMAVDALKLMKENNLNCLPVSGEDGKITGTITLQMLVKAGIVI